MQEQLTLCSVNVGTERMVGNSKSGIYKASTESPCYIGQLGLEGDVISDTKHHGGPDQAVYVYGAVDYKWWEREVSQTLNSGTFGENLTVSNLSSKDVCIGDRLDIGSNLVLQATAPRIPCSTLATRMNDRQFPVKFKKAERPGFYCRVLQSGTVETGDRVRLVPYDTSPRISIVDMFRLYYEPAPSEDKLHSALQVPLAIRERKRLESTLVRIRNKE